MPSPTHLNSASNLAWFILAVLPPAFFCVGFPAGARLTSRVQSGGPCLLRVGCLPSRPPSYLADPGGSCSQLPAAAQHARDSGSGGCGPGRARSLRPVAADQPHGGNLARA